jgi:uncharacterized protein YegP (UPF0339 family)
VNAASGAARTPRGCYQLVEGHPGGFMSTLRAGNHETILESRVFWSRQAALDAVDALRLHHARRSRRGHRIGAAQRRGHGLARAGAADAEPGLTLG